MVEQAYTVLNAVKTGNPSQGVKAGRFDVLIDAANNAEATPILRRAARDLLGDNDKIRIYAYIERIAVKWRGYVAWVEYAKNEAPKVIYDNDPALREAIYLASQGEG